MKVLQILALMFGLTLFVNAQNTEKSFILSGTVFDSEKAVIVGTEITAENKDGRRFKTTSDEKGFYKLSIPFGEYTLVFHKEGFKITKYTNLENLALAEKILDANLEIGTCSDCDGFILEDDNDKKLNNSDISQRKNKNENYLSGVITDQLCAIIPKAKIKVVGNKQRFTTETDENGRYKINLSEGIYTIEFGASGHKSYKIKDYRMGSNQPMSLDIALYAIPTPII